MPPFKFDEPLFGRHVKTQKPLEELGPLHILLEPILVPQSAIVFKQLKQNIEVPLVVVLISQNFCGLDLEIKFSLVLLKVVLVVVLLKVNLEIGDNLLVVHTLAVRHLVEILVGLHEVLREIYYRELVLQHIRAVHSLDAEAVLANHRGLR